LVILPVVVHIIAMPPQVIIIGMPMFIIAIIRWQHSMNMSFMASSIAVISHFIPVGVMVQVILHIIIAIGIMPPIIGMFIGIMPPIIGMFIGIIVGIGIVAVIFGSICLKRFCASLAIPVRGRPSSINEESWPGGAFLHHTGWFDATSG
jgi:hypothetical protein